MDMVPRKKAESHEKLVKLLLLIPCCDLGHFASASVYRCRIRNINHLKARLLEEWHHFDRCITDKAVIHWLQRLHTCIRKNGEHFNVKFIRSV